MSTQENETIVRRLWEEVWNQKALNVCDEILDAEYAKHEKNFAPHIWTAFPDSHHTIEDMIAQGDKVVTRFTWRGTHQGEYQGILPTGKQVEMKGIWIHRLAGDQIVEGRQWGVMDMLGLLQQLGATISPPAQGEV
jgi:predicted ester cyclase